MYVCGPTVYNDVHIGNCRTFISIVPVSRFYHHMDNKTDYNHSFFGITDNSHAVGFPHKVIMLFFNFAKHLSRTVLVE